MIFAARNEKSTQFGLPPWTQAITLMMVVALGCDPDLRAPPRTVELQPNPTPTDPNALREESLGTTKPVHAAGDVYLAGQPAIEDLALMPGQGIKTIISLRHDHELSWAEGAAVKAAGMEFISIPFAGAEELTDEVFDQTRTVLGDRAKHPVVLHCGAANRVGAVWLPYRVLDQGTDLDVALREAREAGLRSSDLEEQAVQYIERQQRTKRSEEETTNSTDSTDQTAPSDSTEGTPE